MADRDGQSRSWERLTAEEMDLRRMEGVAYQYLCHLEEAKRWMEACLGEELPPPTELEECLRNGVLLAKLGHHFSPDTVPLKKMYDVDQARYQALGLQFRHTDNINHWRAAMTALGLPSIFYPETTDVYDKKNMPRVVYCLHALSLYLHRLGLAPQIHDLYGKVDFTEEELNNVKLELDRYGIQMPAFNKIGGILANELSVDQAAAHAAVIAINEAVDRGQAEVTAQALKNPNAMIEYLHEALISVYQELLQENKRQKALNAKNRGRSEEKDIYEEYLTQKEIQQNINMVNMHWAVEQVDQALDSGDEMALLSALSLPCLSLRGLRPELALWYMEQLDTDRQQKALEQGCVDALDPEQLQEGVSTANQKARKKSHMDVALLKLNQCLKGSDPSLTLSSLMSPVLDLPPVLPSAYRLYHSELQQIQRHGPQGALLHEELFVAVEMLTSVAVINEALEAGIMQKFNSSLVSSSAALSDVEPELLHRYFDALMSLKQQSNGAMLNWNQLQNEINSVNNEIQEQHQQLLCLSLINEAVSEGSAPRLLSALKQPSLDISAVVPNNVRRYLILMRSAQHQRAQGAGDPGAELWLTDVQEQVRRANQETQRALKMCLALAAVNQAVREQRPSQTFRVLCLPELALPPLVPHCATQYQEQLGALMQERARSAADSGPWIRTALDDGSHFYFHLNKLEGIWDKPQEFRPNSSFLSRSDIQCVVVGASAEHSRSVQWQKREQLVVSLQAAARGFLLRTQLHMRQAYFMDHISAVVMIQSHWRRFMAQRSYRRRLQYLYMNWRAVVKIQSLVRMWLVRTRFRERLQLFRTNVNAVVKIQAFFRANKAREEYRLLVHSATPPLRVIRKFAHLLELSSADITEEAELLRVRQEVVRTIRFNKQLETDLDLMDLKIGLLVRNRATVQEVASHCKKLTKKNKEQLSDMMDLEKSKGLKALSRERHKRLEAYQHLFYLLQTQPRYLAQLVFLMPQSRSTGFMEMLVFSLFNYGSDRREAFLLLQLFTQALRYEIRLKVQHPQDVVTGNPTVIKMLVNFYRHARGHNALREALGPALKELLLEQNLSIRTDPLEVYKTWVNQTETQTGTKSSLPYDVSLEEALSHPEVQRRIDVAIVNLKNLTERVLKAITSSLHLLPYGLRYTAKVLRDALREKFPGASEADLYKLVGNLVYYRYMNPAVVAPDGFDVLDRSVGSTLSPEQRHLLAAISRMLQHAAANKCFHGDGHHVRMLNLYITNSHQKFRKFLAAVCDVPEPEDRFSVDEYSELLNVNKPVIYISLSELINTHQLLVDHQSVLCSDSADPLRTLLRDLGSVSTLQELSGTAEECSGDTTHVGKTEVSLTLTNKFDIFSDERDQPDARGLLLSTKQMVIDVIRTQPGDSLAQILRSSASQQQLERHNWLVQSRARQDAQTPEKLKRNESLMANSNLSLEQKKRKILRCLRQLETQGVLQSATTEGAILNMIAKDVRQQRLHRQRRGTELMRLRHALNSLQAKSSFQSEQIDFYRHYITSCLEKVTAQKAPENKNKKKALSYSATRLQEKGVLLEIQDLPQAQFKNVLFEIVPGAEKGNFRVKARFLGVQMEEFTVTYQDLLQLQYEGVAVMKMFDKAKVNVNLLIFLLNKKFYNK
ncbi:ras GTPase-activating-like protein IQGAP3 [Eucyclogobius newberryi]|uniref:ras GTPase-activating-like protein IQGAP3 n=1 Tax=Eucyclogobius newberryi TaxID=166745 RepID=UPI003B5A94AB